MIVNVVLLDEKCACVFTVGFCCVTCFAKERGTSLTLFRNTQPNNGLPGVTFYPSLRDPPRLLAKPSAERLGLSLIATVRDFCFDVPCDVLLVALRFGGSRPNDLLCLDIDVLFAVDH